MNLRRYAFRYLCQILPLFLLPCLAASPFFSQAQTSSPQQQGGQTAGTIRVRVGLVQRDVTVVDRQGRFVNDLKQDQFELLIDGKPEPIAFFEQVTAGSPKEELPPARAEGTRASPPSRAPFRGTETGRTLLYFLDDWHLSADSISRLRATLLNLIDTNMGVNDKAAIFTASRQLGFLQQLSDDKNIARLAASRLRFANETVQDLGRPAMNEAQASAIEQGDSDILDYFVDATMSIENLADLPRAAVADVVRGRAGAVARMSAEITARSLSSLTAIVQSCAAIPGRKLLFVLSDGFVLQQQRDDVAGRIKDVTTAAQRAGVVIYALDTRGLVVGLPDAASPVIFAAPVVRDAAGSPPNQLERLQRGFSDVLVRQDGLNALASDTGGRFLKNTNALGTAITETLEETSRYYLLGWHVDPDKLQAGHVSSIRVAIKDRPDLKASLRQSSIDLSTLFSKEPKLPDRASSKTTARSELVKAIEHPWPIDTLPISLYAGYLYRSDKGYALDVSLQADVEDTDTGTGSAKEDAHIDIMVAIANRDGAKVDSFMEPIFQPVEAANQSKGGIRRLAYSRLISIEAGIYQVRVAARDPKSGKVGTAHQWIDVRAAAPDQVFLGSIFLAAGSFKAKSPVELTEASLDENQFSIERRFNASSGLSFMLEIYNPSKRPVMFQTRVYRGNRAVMQSMPQPVLPEAPSDTGLQFISSEVPLEGLVTGPYVFEVSTTDPSGKITATQRVPFWIQ